MEDGPKKESAFELYKRKYLPNRRAARKVPAVNSDRLSAKSDIAEAVIAGDTTLALHFQKLRERIDRGKKERGVGFAARISDGVWSSPKREPSLVETILATQESDDLYKKVSDAVGDRALEVLRVGSSFWGRNYSLRGKERGDASDIDLDVIVSTIPADFPYPKVEAGILNFQDYFERGEADYCSGKVEVGGVKVSFHLIPIETFRKICDMDYALIETPVNLREFRITEQPSPKTYHQKNFAGDTYTFSTTPLVSRGGQVSEIPLVMIGGHGELVLGVALNRYLPPPDLNHGDNLVQKELQRLFGSLKQRKNLDELRMKDRKLSFSNFHAHAAHMPQWMKDKLKALD